MEIKRQNSNIINFDQKNINDLYASLKKEIDQKELLIHKLKLLIEVNSVISSSLDKKVVLKNILDQTKLIMKCNKSSILLVDSATNELKFEVLTHEADHDQLKDVRLKMGEGIAGFVWQRGKPVLIKDVNKDSRFSKKADQKSNFLTTSLIAVPLIVKGKVIGVMEAINKEDRSAFNDFDLEILNCLSVQAAIAIENANLYQLATTDGLTRLYIHRYFQHRLEEEFNRALRYENELSMVLFDLDHFKKVNDVYGHQAGDEVLIGVANIIKNSCRTTDLPCRYGGEELCVIFPQTDLEHAAMVSERIRAAIEKLRINSHGLNIRVTISGGIASLKVHKPASKIEFIKMTDTALYHAKENGRNKITVFSKNSG